ncbi:MAG: glycosyltransferase [Epsilonproteobacteria bacterium]|nr:glycosyltransferase [Campylobacterota bacterium]
MTLITVIVPLYNGERFIAETIESVLSQTYQNFELIVVDDCSTDNSCDIIQTYASIDPRIILIRSETNFGGPAKPRNIGIKHARGEFIAFLDADDVWKPHKLQTQVDFLTANMDIDMVYSPAVIMDENGATSQAKKQVLLSILSLFMHPKNTIFYLNFININTLMIRNPIFNTFIEDKKLVAIEDWIFHILNFQAGKQGKLLDEALIYYRIHSASISSRASDKSYRKIFYMYSLLLLESKISFLHFLFANTLNSCKLLRRKIAIAWSSS